MTMDEMIKKFLVCKGETRSIGIDGLTVKVKVLDLRQVWNRIDALITPISGEGETWIDADRLKEPRITVIRSGNIGDIPDHEEK